MQLLGKRVVIAGGASGIGAATVRAFVREGASVVSMDIDDVLGRAVVEQASETGPGTVAYLHCDVTSKAEVQSAFSEAVDSLHGLDVLVHTAGLEQARRPEDVTEDDIDQMLSVHVKGTIFTNQAAYESMRSTGGSIINYASVAGVQGSPFTAGYAAAKGAVLAWTRTIAKVWGAQGVRANAVCPLILTPMAQRFRDGLTSEGLASFKRSMALSIPLGGEFGDPDLDIAPAMVFLGSEASRFITGQTFAIDGGNLMLT